MSLTDLAKSNPEIKETLTKLLKDGQNRETAFQEAVRGKAQGENRRNLLNDIHRGMVTFLSHRRELGDVEKRVRILC